MDTLGERVKKTAAEVAERFNEMAQRASERLSEMNELQRLSARRRALTRERDQCRLTIADLLIRMFDQDTFAEALLRPEYHRIKEIDAALADLEEERKQVQARHAQGAETAPAAAEVMPEEAPYEAPIVADDVPPVWEERPEETPPGGPTA